MCTRRIAKKLITLAGLLLGIALTAGSAFAQQIEIHPYAGGFFPGKWNDTGHLKNEGIYGVRGGIYLMDFVQLDANFGYINHFKFKDAPDLGTRAYIWDINASYSLNKYNIKKVEPFLTIGLGALSTGIHDASRQTISVPSPDAPLKDNDSFLQFTYGVGVKAIRLKGPIGLRLDVRGRTLPNFYGSALTWLETTGGFNVVWGER